MITWISPETKGRVRNFFGCLHHLPGIADSCLRFLGGPVDIAILDSAGDVGNVQRDRFESVQRMGYHPVYSEWIYLSIRDVVRYSINCIPACRWCNQLYCRARHAMSRKSTREP